VSEPWLAYSLTEEEWNAKPACEAEMLHRHLEMDSTDYEPKLQCAVCGEAHGTGEHNNIIESESPEPSGNKPPLTPDKRSLAPYITEALTDYWGPRCDTFDELCHACHAWREYDDLRVDGGNNPFYGSAGVSRQPPSDPLVRELLPYAAEVQAKVKRMLKIMTEPKSVSLADVGAGEPGERGSLRGNDGPQEYQLAESAPGTEAPFQEPVPPNHCYGCTNENRELCVEVERLRGLIDSVVKSAWNVEVGGDSVSLNVNRIDWENLKNG
jgi:hypothetical protein